MASAAGASDPPYAVAAGGVLIEGPGTPFEVAYPSLVSCSAFVGATPDCPSTDPAAACFFGEFQDGAACSSNGGILNPCASYAHYCSKIRWDTAFRAPCCLGQLDGVLMSYTDINTGGSQSLPAAQLACDPRWCPGDPVSACGDVFSVSCNDSYSADGGATWANVMLGDPAEQPCAAWYTAALGVPSLAPASRWPFIDTVIEEYCTAAEHWNEPGCGCFLYALSADGTGVCEQREGRPCFFYTSVSAPTPTDNGLRPVRPVNSATQNPVGFSDYACIAPACQGTEVLRTADVWAMQHSGACPNVCLQVIQDGNVVVEGDTIPGGIYIDTAVYLCDGSLASASLDTPALMDVTSGITMDWPHYATCSTYPVCCPPGGCNQTVPLVFALASHSGDMHYSVSFDPPDLPAGVAVSNPFTLTGTLSNDRSSGLNSMLDLQFTVDAASTPLGVYLCSVTVADTRAQFPTCRATTVLTMTVYDTSAPAPPQGPVGPNPGTGPLIIYQDVTPTWVLWAVCAVVAVVAILAIRQLVLWGQRRSILAATAPSAPPSVPSVPAQQPQPRFFFPPPQLPPPQTPHWGPMAPMQVPMPPYRYPVPPMPPMPPMLYRGMSAPFALPPPPMPTPTTTPGART